MQRYFHYFVEHLNGGIIPSQLWMGTHPKSPSLVLNSRQVLSERLASHPELIGKSVIEKFNAGNGNLPFLFKVLSIEKALSIQTHPDKKTAEILHAQYPDIYKGMWLYEYLFYLSQNFYRPKSQTRNGSGHNPVSSLVRFQTSF